MKKTIILMSLIFSFLASAATFQLDGDGTGLTPGDVVKSLKELSLDDKSAFTKTMKTFDVGFADTAFEQVASAIQLQEEILINGSGGTGGYSLLMAIPVYYGYKSTSELVGWAYYEVESSYDHVLDKMNIELTFKASKDFKTTIN